MRVRLAIRKKHSAVAGITDRVEERMYSEVEIQVPVYDIIKALNIDINEHTKGNDILVKINELKSNKFNRIERLEYKRIQMGIEYKITIDIGETKIYHAFYIDAYDLKFINRNMEEYIYNMREELKNKYGILLSESESKEIESYLYKHS